MKVLILDDMEVRHEGFRKKFNRYSDTIVSTYTVKQCIKELDQDRFDMICLDHDLGGKKSGYDVCKWLINNPEKARSIIIIHTNNPVGAKNMYDILRKQGINSIIHPGYWYDY